MPWHFLSPGKNTKSSRIGWLWQHRFGPENLEARLLLSGQPWSDYESVSPVVSALKASR